MLRPLLLLPLLVLAPSACAIDFYGYELDKGAGGDDNPPEAPWQRVEVGGNHTCALTRNNKLYCWGQPDFGKLGAGDNPTMDGLTLVVAPELESGDGHLTGTREFALGAYHTCASTEENVFCWGDNDDKQWSRTNNYPASSWPVALDESSGRVVKLLATGQSSTCVVTEADNRIDCWGIVDSPEPFTETKKITHLTVGAEHACVGIEVQTNVGAVKCWGTNGHGQLGGEDGDTNTPTPAVDSGGLDSGLVAGARHTCALTGELLFCWGDNTKNQLGLQAPLAEGVRAFALGEAHTCYSDTSDVVFCVGSNSEGQLGVPIVGTAEHATPQRVPDLPPVESLSAGGNHTCAVTKGDSNGNKQLFCWGDNAHGQIPGATTDPAPPTEIIAP